MKSFTGRITVLFVVLVTVTTGVVLAIGGWQLSRAAVTGLDFLNRAEFREVQERLGPEPATLRPAEIDRRLRSHTLIDSAEFYFQLHNDAGELLFRSDNLGSTVLPDLTGRAPNWTGTLPDLGVIRESEFHLGTLRIQIASSLDPAQRLIESYTHTSLVLLGGVVLLSCGLGWSFARLALRPVRAIRETATRIGADNLGERIAVPGGRDELAALAGLLNQMLGRLEASFLQVKRFTADASHELKTPLALMRLNAEKLRPRFAADPEVSEALDDLLEDLDRMRRIIDSLLFLTQADSGGLAPVRAVIETGDFVRNFAEDAAALADDRGVRFTLARADAGQVTGESTLLRQLLLNLVSNACRVLAPGGEVTLDSRLEPRRWRLVVSDNGPGLPADQLERVFERFVRLTPAGQEPDAAGGHGLGLAICRSIATLHGGRIFAENRRGTHGLRVVVEIPHAPAPSP
ncbi:MAG: sensor histidine kinase [Opitutales bacterium]